MTQFHDDQCAASALRVSKILVRTVGYQRRIAHKLIDISNTLAELAELNAAFLDSHEELDAAIAEHRPEAFQEKASELLTATNQAEGYITEEPS